MTGKEDTATKTLAKWEGPFEVTSTSNGGQTVHMFNCRFPDEKRTRHISQLKKYVGPRPEVEPEWVVAEILDEKKQGKEWRYLIKWKVGEESWEPCETIDEDVPDKVKEWRKRRKEPKGRKSKSKAKKRARNDANVVTSESDPKKRVKSGERVIIYRAFAKGGSLKRRKYLVAVAPEDTREDAVWLMASQIANPSAMGHVEELPEEGITRNL